MKEITEYKVIPINRDAIKQYLNETLNTNPETTRYNVKKVAWLKNTDAITDNECVYSNLYKELHGKEIVYVADIDVRVDTKSDKGWSCAMFPSFYLHFTLDDLIEKYGLPEIDLKEFMIGRYNYNPRIERNTFNLMEAYPI